jgi:hypothetical protein
MSCFWKGLAKKVPELRNKTPNQVLEYMQQRNCLSTHVEVKINNKPNNLSLSQLKEQHEAIRAYHHHNKVHNGHLTSCHDPFLMLVVQLFGHQITFDFAGTSIELRNTRLMSNLVIRFKSSTSHFT